MPTTPASYETKDLKKLKVADLRAILEANGADSTGKKDELIAKIQASQGPSDEPAPEPSPEPSPEPKKSPPTKNAKAAKSPPAKKPKKATPTEETQDDDEPRPVNNFFFNKEVAAHGSSSSSSDDDDDDDDDERPEPEPEPEEPVVEEEPEPPAHDENREIYVGFLGDNCDRKFIAELFRPYFEVTRVHMPMQSEPGGGPKRPKGYAFVTVPRHADPSVAIDALDQSETFPGAKHPLKVSLAKKNDVWANRDDDRSGTKRRRDDRGDTRGGNKGGVPPGKSPERLYILGLPTRITEVLLKEVYSQYGSVVDARVLRSRDGEEGGPKRGQVTFAAASDAAKAKAATDNTRAFHGSGELRVVYANLREGETRRDGGGARARQGTAMQPWQVYPMQPGIPLYTPMVPVMVDPDTGQPIVPRTQPIVNDEGGKKAPASGKSAAGYTGIHLAGLPPSATVDAKYAHLYQ